MMTATMTDIDVIQLANVISNLPDSDQPAMGWIDNLRVIGQSLYGDLVRIPSRMLAVVIRHYRNRSCELYRGTAKRPFRGVEGWVLVSCAFLGVRLPAMNLADLPDTDPDGSINGVELMRSGEWEASTGLVRFSVDDLRQIVANWKALGIAIPVTWKLGHGELTAALAVDLADAEPCLLSMSEFDAAPVDPVRDVTLANTTGGDQMAEKTMQELQAEHEAEVRALTAKLAASEAEKVQLSAEKAQSAELKAKLETVESQRKADSDRLVALEQERRESRADAWIAKLAEPTDRGDALPIPAMLDAGLRDVVIATVEGGAVKLADGESIGGKLKAVLDQVRKSGMTKLQTSLPAGSSDDANRLSKVDEAIKAEYDANKDRLAALGHKDWQSYKAAISVMSARDEEV